MAALCHLPLTARTLHAMPLPEELAPLRIFCAIAHSGKDLHIERLTLCGEYAGKCVLNYAQSNAANVAAEQRGLSLKKHQWTCRKSGQTHQARKTRSSQY